MKARLLTLIFIIISLDANGQTGGSPADAFTSLGQAWFATVDGLYWFNIGGTLFTTFVEAGNGWVLAASGNASTSESSYSTTTNLTLQSDQILPTAIYTSTLVTDVRMNSTAGPSIPFDVQSSDITVLDNLQNNRTLSVGTNSEDWSGIGTARLLRTCPSENSTLSTHIYHACGQGENLFWLVGLNPSFEKLRVADASKNDLNLWIRAASVPLPIELLDFTALMSETGVVILNWETALESNNHFFTVERSLDGRHWEVVARVDGAGNSYSARNYTAIDQEPHGGISYYRLKQTDFDGQFSYSTTKSIHNQEDILLKIYPNVTNGVILITGSTNELENITIFNASGQIVTKSAEVIGQSENTLTMDLSRLSIGWYIVRTRSTAKRVFRQ